MKRFLFMLGLSLLFVVTGFAAQPIKILAIGNSFSEDAVEQNLHEIAAADGVDMIIVNLYIGGCSLERHDGNVKNNTPDYRYRRIGLDGKTIEKQHVALSQVIGEEQWDYVSLQQASHFSGQWNTYEPYLDDLVTYVRANVPKSAKLLWHQTWAYSQNSDHSGFKNYGRSQSAMYASIIDCSKKVMDTKKFKKVVPCGTAVQNARTSSMGDNFCRDGYHLQLNYGRFLAACTWYEVLTGKNVTKNTFLPAGVTEQQATIVRKAAHDAVRSPFRVTPQQH